MQTITGFSTTICSCLMKLNGVLMAGTLRLLQQLHSRDRFTRLASKCCMGTGSEMAPCLPALETLAAKPQLKQMVRVKEMLLSKRRTEHSHRLMSLCTSSVQNLMTRSPQAENVSTRRVPLSCLKTAAACTATGCLPWHLHFYLTRRTVHRLLL